MQIRLRQLARRYYTGELTKAEYRRARQMVLVAALEGREIEEEITLPIQKKLESHTDKEPTDTQPAIKKQPKNTQQALASLPTGEAISPQQKKRPILAYWLVAMLMAVAAYWVFMQTEQDNNIVQTPPLSESDKAVVTVGQVPKSEEQVMAENLIYADEWNESEVNLMIEKLSMADFSAKPWYQQLKDEVQTRQELLILDKAQATNPQYMAALNKLASALGLNMGSDTSPGDLNQSPVKQPVVEAQTENILPEDEAIIFPRLDEKPKVKPQAVDHATVIEQQQQEVKRVEPESSTGSVSKQKPNDLPWEVDLIVLKGEKKLRQQQQVLSQHGVQAQIAALEDKPGYWRLYVGSYATKDAAQAIAKKIQGLDLGYDKPWVKLRKEIAEKQGAKTAAKTKTASQSQAKDNCTAKAAATRRPYCQDELVSGKTGPRLVVLPSGTFTMGEAQEPSTSPVRQVNITKPFAISQSEISYAQYLDYCQSAGVPCPSSPWKGQHPVVDVSWEDAVNYANWLSQQTGQNYRLPSEAEWEYACRGKTQTEYPFAQGLTPANANYGTPSGSPEPISNNKNYNKNGFRLYHMVGNVQEWVQDTWHANHAGAPTDARPRAAGTSQRVVRGGSYQDPADRLRSAARQPMAKNNKDKTTGFRLVREIMQ